MKSYFTLRRTLIVIMLLTAFNGMSQNKQSVQILQIRAGEESLLSAKTELMKFCSGDTIRLLGKTVNVNDKGEFVWNRNIVSKMERGDSILIPTSDQQDTIQIFCKYIFDIDSIPPIKSDTFTVVINQNPNKNRTVTHFKKDDDIILEVSASNPEEIYTWANPSGQSKTGAIVRFTGSELSEPRENTLTITNKQGCTTTIKYNVELKEESKPSNVFGTIDSDKIPNNLYKEITKDVTIRECDINGNPTNSPELIATSGYKFTIIAEKDNNYIIKFWNWPQNDKSFKIGNSTMKYSICNSQMAGNLDMISNTITLTEENSKNSVTLTTAGTFTLSLSKIPTILHITSEDKKINQKITIHPTNSKNEKYVYAEGSLPEENRYRYFLIRKSDVEAKTRSFLPRNWKQNFSSNITLTAGTVLIPIKLRPSNNNGGQFNFSSDVALGPFIGAKKRISSYREHFASIGFNIGISSVNVSPDNTDIQDQVALAENSELIDFKEQNFAAFTYSLGLVFEFSNVQIGAFIGKDLINNNDYYQWQYHKKTWYSIGLGYSILSRPDKSRVGAGNNSNK